MANEVKRHVEQEVVERRDLSWDEKAQLARARYLGFGSHEEVDEETQELIDEDQMNYKNEDFNSFVCNVSKTADYIMTIGEIISISYPNENLAVISYYKEDTE